MKVRESLNLGAGDDIVYQILDNEIVVLRKSQPLDIDYLEAINATLSDWTSVDDERAYSDL